MSIRVPRALQHARISSGTGFQDEENDYHAAMEQSQRVVCNSEFFLHLIFEDDPRLNIFVCFTVT